MSSWDLRAGLTEVEFHNFMGFYGKLNKHGNKRSVYRDAGMGIQMDIIDIYIYNELQSISIEGGFPLDS